jgi:hypothetical protein
MGFSMTDSKNFHWLIVWLCSFGALAPNFAFAADLARKQVRKSIDVTLQSDDVLIGHLVDQTGIARADVPVTVYASSHVIAVEATDAAGIFRVKNMRPGTYTIVVGDTVRTCRIWDAVTAPPSANKSVLLVSGDTVRGQLMNGGSGRIGGVLGRAVSDPWIVGGLVATAIAVPLATRDNDDAS